MVGDQENRSRALLAHRDGAAVVAGTHAAEPATLDLAEALIGALLAAGRPERDAAWTLWSLIYFTLGLAQEEQAGPGPLEVGDRPALRRVRTHLTAGDFDERFEFGLRALLDSQP